MYVTQIAEFPSRTKTQFSIVGTCSLVQPRLALFPFPVSYSHLPPSAFWDYLPLQKQLSLSPFSSTFLLAFDYFSLCLGLVSYCSLTCHQLWNPSEVYGPETPGTQNYPGPLLPLLSSYSSSLLFQYLQVHCLLLCPYKVRKDDMESIEFMSFKENILPEQISSEKFKCSGIILQP